MRISNRICFVVLSLATHALFPARDCCADEKEQIELIEKYVAQLEQLHLSAAEYANTLARINDISGAETHWPTLRKSGPVLINDLRAATASLAALTKMSSAAKLSQHPVYGARANAAAAKFRSFSEDFRSDLEAIVLHLSRVDELKGLSGQFYSEFKVQRVDILVAMQDVATAGGVNKNSPVARSTRALQSLYQKHGYDKTCEIVIPSNTESDVGHVTQAVRNTLGPKAELVTVPLEDERWSLVVVAPVPDLNRLAAALDLGHGNKVFEAERLIELSSPNETPNYEGVPAAKEKLLDSGRFSFSGKNDGVERSLDERLARRGAKGILLVDLVDRPINELREFPAHLYWHSESYNWFLTLTSNDNSVVRVFLTFDGSPADFAKQVEIGEVVRVDEPNRIVAIRIDTAKVSPEVLLETKRFRDPRFSFERRHLQEYADVMFLKGIAKKQGRYLDPSLALRAGLFLTEDELFESSKARSSLADKSRILGAESRQSARLRASGTKADEQVPLSDYVLGELVLPEFAPAVPIADVKKLADILNLTNALPQGRFEDSIHFREIRVEAMAALVRIRPEDVSDKALRGQIAKGFRDIALDRWSGIRPSLGSNENVVVQGLVRWGGKYSIPIFVEMLNQFGGEKRDVMRALAYFKDPSTASDVAQHLGEIDSEIRQMSYSVLQAIGPPAEDAVMKVAPSNRPAASLAAVALLGEIGTKKSLPLLAKAANSPNARVRDAAAASAKRIQERQPSNDK